MNRVINRFVGLSLCQNEVFGHFLPCKRYAQTSQTVIDFAVYQVYKISVMVP
jgi:hypothetical protein